MPPEKVVALEAEAAEVAAAEIPDEKVGPKVVDLAVAIPQPPIGKRVSSEFSIAFERGEAKRRYTFADADGVPVHPWLVEIRNGECLANGGRIPGKAIFIKDGFNQVVDALENPDRASVVDAIDALIESLGLMP